MARPNPRDTTTETNGGIFEGWFGDIFGTPTVKKTPTPTPQVTTPSYIPPPQQTPTIPTYMQDPIPVQSNPRGKTTTTTSQKTYCMIVNGYKLQLTSDAINWYIDNGVDVRPCDDPTPTTTPTSNGNLEARVAQLEKVQNTYPQIVGSASQKSDQDIWDHLDEHVWGHTGNVNAIYPQLQQHVAGHQEVHTKLQDLGDALLSAKEHRDSIEAKLEEQRKHTHNTPPPPNGCECEWYDLGCKWNCGWEKYGTIIMIVGGLIGLGILLWLLRPLFSVLGMFSRGSP